MLSGSSVWASNDLKLNSVVIDAGHGGKDPGAVSADKKFYEKNFTLDISKKLAEKITSAYPDVKVTLTRNDDSFVSLNDRAVIANRAGAKLFISIHINASRNHDANGYSAHVLGQSSIKDRDLFAYNMDICKRENSVVLLEEDYSTKYQGFDPNDEESYIFMMLMQNSNLEQSLNFAQMVSDEMQNGPIANARGVWQNPFYVLWKTSMPAVLLELGFISNKEDLEVLNKRRDEIVDRIYIAFLKYKKEYEDAISAGNDSSGKNTSPEVAVPASSAKVATDAQSAKSDTLTKKPEVIENKQPDIKYGVQIFAGKNLLFPNDKQFLGYQPEIVKVGELYKYVIGVSTELQTTKENYLKIKEKYPNSFIIKLENGVISRLQ